MARIDLNHRHTLLVRLISVALLAWGSLASGQTAPSEPPGVPQRRANPVPMDVAAGYYRVAFGREVGEEEVAKLYRAHLLVEEFFADAPPIPGARREAIIAELEKSGVTPAEVARLCSIRLSWRAVEPGVYYVNDRMGPFTVRYFVGVPKGYIAGTPMPLVLMLPTATEFAAKPDLGPEAVTDVYSAWIKDELRARPGNLVVMPLLHLTDLWGPGYAGMHNAMKPLQDVCERFSVDVRRVYLRGQGMSGHAVWNLALHYASYFAAINPLAGGASYDFQRLRTVNLRNTLPVVWHDSEDKAVPVKLSREMVSALRLNKIDVVYEETKGVGHQPGPVIERRLYERMIARTRELYPKQVTIRNNRPDTAFGRLDWVQLWQPADPGQEMRTIFRWSGTGMWTFTNVITVDARITSPNRIDIDAKNLGSMRLLLSRDMVDFTKPLSVFVGRRQMFAGTVRESMKLTLKDQLSLGRGWREFTGAVEIDMSGPSTRPTTRSTPATSPASSAP